MKAKLMKLAAAVVPIAVFLATAAPRISFR